MNLEMKASACQIQGLGSRQHKHLCDKPPGRKNAKGRKQKQLLDTMEHGCKNTTYELHRQIAIQVWFIALGYGFLLFGFF